MTNQTPSVVAPSDLPILAILGLRTPEEGNWNRIQGLQQASLGKYRLPQILVTMALALMVFELSRGFVPVWVLLGWMGLLAFALGVPSQTIRDRLIGKEFLERKNQMLGLSAVSFCIGVLWTIPILFFAPLAGDYAMAAIWTVSAALVVASVLLLRALPLGALLLNAMVMAASTWAFWRSGDLVMAAVVLTFSILLMMVTLENARAYLLLNLSQAGLSEKSEVVSLLLREFEESGADWLWQIDSGRRIVHPSPRFAFAAGCETSELIGEPLIKAISGPAWDSGNFPPSLRDLAERLKRRESFSNLVVRVHIGGEPRWWELSASPIQDEHGAYAGFRGVGSDVTESRKSSEKIARMARFDNLTGLPNRLQITEALDQAMEQAEKWRSRCGFLMIDLDRFKSVNDTLGHQVGDRLLAQVSQRLRAIMSQNELCGRLGGDEFAVVLRDASDEVVVNDLAEKIISTLSRPYDVDQQTLYIGASVGSAVGPRDGQSVETLMRNADLALYRSKDEGGGRHYCYEPQLHVSAEERRVMEMALRKALEKDEFSLNFQPVVSAETEAVTGFEALIRWFNPEFGQVPPGKFIPIAEEARLVVPIGNWVLHKACQEAALWPASVKVAVNVSAEQLFEADFVETVVESLSESGLPPQRLELEVTESVFLREGSRASETLEKILALGVGLALDDFGTGYSALGYLSKTRFSTIKVDRSFVQGAAQGMQESTAIICAVVAMAKSLGMKTTAEGVETEQEVEMVRGMGCDRIQGYFYGRPMNIEEVHGLFNEQRSAKLA